MRTALVASLAILAAACRSESGDGPVSWGAVTDKPATFPTTWSEVADRPATFPSEWTAVANRPSTFPTDPTLVQARVSGTCAGGGAMSAIDASGAVTCAPARPVTVQLPAPTWAAFQCASVTSSVGLGGVALPALRFDPEGTCGTVRKASTVVAIPHELPEGPRPFRVRAVVSVLDSTGPVSLALDWSVATAAAGIGATACGGTTAVAIPALQNVQATTTIELDLRDDPGLCGGRGDPLVLVLERTDAASNTVAVRSLHAVFE